MEKYGDTLSIILVLEGTYIIYKMFLESSNLPLVVTPVPTAPITEPPEIPFPKENDPNPKTDYKSYSSGGMAGLAGGLAAGAVASGLAAGTYVIVKAKNRYNRVSFGSDVNPFL